MYKGEGNFAMSMWMLKVARLADWPAGWLPRYPPRRKKKRKKIKKIVKR